MRRWHLSKDLKLNLQTPEESFRNRLQSAQGPKTGAHLMCSRNGREGIVDGDKGARGRGEVSTTHLELELSDHLGELSLSLEEKEGLD